ncbi:hypothetical protein BDZ94DRAFT_1309527 [Collybia nuda]|uniref:Core-binding (CB) domain-containing protein n=1 Tax=Collybia nuda TaxID=64659 RepID=A0A9P5Y5J9_9AGAR|nr:hypothetical protein BDZ94DRAFT_1309527 [Collybia nuda]
MLQQASFYLWHGLTSSTQKTYSSGQKSFIDSACLHPNFLDKPGKFLPTIDQSISKWICSLRDHGLQPKTIKSHLSAVCSLHMDEGLPFTACESETVHQIIQGIKCFHSEQEQNPKQPITLPILQQLASSPGGLSSAFNASFNTTIKLA